MPKQPKHPQISIRGATYQKLKDYCRRHDIPIAKLVDQICGDFFQGVKPIFSVDELKPRPGNEPKA